MKILIAGSSGMVGKSLVLLLKKKKHNVIQLNSKNCNLENKKKVGIFLKKKKPNIVICLAAKVGGIKENIDNGYEFISKNLLIQTNLITECEKNNVNKFIFVGSSCIYPKNAKQPFKEESLLTGKLEETNQYYAISKIAGIKLTEAINKYKNKYYISIMPPNLYGPNDNFDENTSHVMAALIKKIFLAKTKSLNSIAIWGNGKSKREFLYVDDLSRAILFLIRNKTPYSIVNIGSEEEITIGHLAKKIGGLLKYKGKFKFDESKPSGVKRKLMNSSKIRIMGWRPKVNLNTGIKKTISWYKKNVKR
jgi:GDP-L-fucose synthase